jgi:hypothetical protein
LFSDYFPGKNENKSGNMLSLFQIKMKRNWSGKNVPRKRKEVDEKEDMKEKNKNWPGKGNINGIMKKLWTKVKREMKKWNLRNVKETSRNILHIKMPCHHVM